MVPSLDLGTWEKVDSESEKLLCKGVPLPVSIWSTWALIKSILEPLQTPESSKGNEDEPQTPSKGGPEYAEVEGVEKKHRRLLKLQFFLYLCLGKTVSSASFSSLSCLNHWNGSGFSFLKTDSSSVTPPERYLSDLTGE